MAADGGTSLERNVAASARSGQVFAWTGDDPATISASFVRDLLLDATTHPKGVRIDGLRITGTLDLENTTVPVPLHLADCELGDLALNAASVPSLVLRDCRAGSFAGDSLRVAAGALLDGTTFTGPVSLIRAKVDGGLSAGHARFEGMDQNGDALAGHGLDVGGHLLLNGATARGGVNLAGAEVAGQVVLREARIEGRGLGGLSLFADRLRADGGLFLTYGFTADGPVRVALADIAGLDCLGARLLGADEVQGYALVVDDTTVRGSVFLNQGFEAAGAVRLLGASITGNLQITDARLAAADVTGIALLADSVSVHNLRIISTKISGVAWLAGAHVSGQMVVRDTRIDAADGEGDSLYACSATVGADLLLDRGFAAAGTVRFDRSAVGGTLLVRSKLDGRVAFSADRAVIGTLDWHPSEPVEGEVSLQGARAGALRDDWSVERGHWPPPGHLTLTGFTYDVLVGDATWRDRLAWLRLQHGPGRGFARQPYSQLVRVYRAAGHDDDARRIAIARQDDLREHGGLGRTRRWGNRFLGVTIRHGYQPGRAILFLLATYVALTAAFAYGQHRPGQFVPRGTDAAPADAALHCRTGTPCFYPALYALDVVVPILDVNDAGDAWRPDARAGWGWVFVSLTVFGTVVGWGATTLAVVGFTNAVRKE